MDIDLGNEIVFKVKLNGQTHEMREPTLKDVKNFQAGSAENAEQGFLDFVVSLGLPLDVAENMGVTKLKKLSESLIVSFDEKK